MSVGTSDASEFTPAPVPAPVPVPTLVNQGVSGEERRKKFPAVVIDSDVPNSPKTTITPPTPTEPPGYFPPKSPVGVVVNGSNRRRSRTNSLTIAPSKLSQTMTTDGSSPPEPPNSAGGGGFFQTMFSAAQNAATSLSSNIPPLNLVPGPTRSRSTTLDDTSERDKSPTMASAPASDEKQGPRREPAIKTLGMGELNLAALGILPEPLPTTRTDRTSAVSAGGNTVGRYGHARGTGSGDDGQYDERQLMPQSATSLVGFDTAVGRTPYAEDAPPFQAGSNAQEAASSGGEMTPDRNSLGGLEDDYTTDGNRKRSGSVQSSNAPATPGRRSRGASTSGNYLAPIPTRPTGFAVASKKRNRDFHNLFKSVPEEDYLIEDYGCALQREILLQGRFYVSEGHICFYSNILGWVTTLVISFNEVMSVEKKSTALLFPNAIVVQTLHARHTFASFISRDSTFDLILGLWNIGHPQIVAANGEAHLDGAPSGDSVDEDDDEYEDNSDDELGESYTDAGDGPFEEEDNGAVGATSKGPSRKPSQLPLVGGAATGDNAELIKAATGDFPGPRTHPPTVCGDDDKHYDRLLCDEILPAPLGKVYSLLFGPLSYAFATHLLAEEEKVLELQIPNGGEWSDVEGKKVRNYSYVKPLSGGIGPSKTRCLITETIDFNDLEDHVSVTVSTQTPDVPSGSIFSVKTRYCLMWAEGGGTRIISNCTVEWIGKSWLKGTFSNGKVYETASNSFLGPIEKGASDGQIAFNKSLLSSLRREIIPKRAAGKGGKGKKNRRDTDARTRGGRAVGASSVVAVTPGPESWGLFEFLRPYLGPIGDILGPMLPANFGIMVMAVLVTWFIATRFRSPAANNGQMTATGRYPPYYNLEDMWKNQEERMWDWIEDRVGMDGVPGLQYSNREGKRREFERKYAAKAAGKGIKSRQVDEAIAVMEERLESLKRLVDKDKKPDIQEDTNE